MEGPVAPAGAAKASAAPKTGPPRLRRPEGALGLVRLLGGLGRGAAPELVAGRVPV